MPFPFALPTTSHLTFPSHLTSSTHPSLPSTATSHRTVLRSALKAHRHSSGSAPSQDLQTLLSAVNTYIPFLLTLDAALSGQAVSGEEVDVALTKEIEVEWRPTLSSSNVPGRDAARVKGRGLDYEIYSVLQTLATVHNLLARQALLRLYASTTPTPEQRLASIQAALSHLRTANSIHLYLLHRTHASSDGPPVFPPRAIDVSPSVQSALAELSLAEATLLLVLKDDPYPAVLIQSRNKNDKEWMIKAPDLPKVRAHLLARLCLSAAEHAGVAASSLKAESGQLPVSGDMAKYCEDLRRTSRAKACRFLAVDADLGGQTGEAIAWLHGGMNEVGHNIPSSPSTTTSSSGSTTSKPSAGFSRLKSSWNERREDKRLAKGLNESASGSGSSGGGSSGEWGSDAGKMEEGRVLAWLEARLAKMNNTINVQLVPDWRVLLASTLPSGRDGAVKTDPWTPRFLAEDDLSRMRAPFLSSARFSAQLTLGSDDDDDDDDDDDEEEGDRDEAGPDSGVGARSAKNLMNNSNHHHHHYHHRDRGGGDGEYAPRNGAAAKKSHYPAALAGQATKLGPSAGGDGEGSTYF